MTSLAERMPRIIPSAAVLREWGQIWLGTDGTARQKAPNCFDRKQAMDFGKVFDLAFGEALAAMLGGVEVVPVTAGQGLIPPHPNCVEVGEVQIIGGIRPQHFDAAYRPDGPRVVLDSKTLNDTSSVGKNWQNMVNDLGTEATTIHTRFPYCVVALIVAIPAPALLAKQRRDLVRTLERLGSRSDVLDQAHLAEAIAMVVWDPHTGELDADVPGAQSPIHLNNVSQRIYDAYTRRYQGLPPHDD